MEPNYKQLWNQWSQADKDEFLTTLYKEQMEYSIRWPLQKGEVFILDKSKHKLVFKNESESSVQIEVVEK